MEKQQLIELYTYRVENAIKNADGLLTKLGRDQFDVIGMSSTKVRIFLNEIIKPDTKYLEIGVWAGSTFVAALHGNTPLSAIAIDNFSEFTDDINVNTKKVNFETSLEDIAKLAEEEALNPVQPSSAFFDNLKKNNISNYKFINSDCFKLNPEDKESIKDINVYLYDGGHTAEDHKNALTYYLDNMSDIFILIIDDWNFPPVKEGTAIGLQETNLKIHKHWELPANSYRKVVIDDKEVEIFDGDASQWWNGYYVAVCEKQK